MAPPSKTRYLAGLGILIVSACGDEPPPNHAAEEMDEAGEAIGRAAEETGDAAVAGAEALGEATVEGAEELGEEVDETAEELDDDHAEHDHHNGMHDEHEHEEPAPQY